jgi:GNAT superfamily N-acetyltransferase
MAIRIRPAAPQDADVLLRLIDGLNEHVGAATGKLTREMLIADAFGDEPRFQIAVAEVDGTVAGYTAWCEAYETEHAMAGLYMIDLYVDPDIRRHGLAHRLVSHVAATCRRLGRGFVWWTAEPTNQEASGFYASLGTHSELMVAHALFGERFEALADESE